MPNGIKNWNYTDVRTVLREHGFKLNAWTGSHHFYIASHSGKRWQVAVPFHGPKIFKPRTMKGIITQSGLKKQEWGIK